MFLLRRLLGVKTEDKKQTKVSKLVKNELLLINIGSTSTGGRVLSVKGDLAKIQLTSPACTEVGEKVALSRRIEKHWRLVGESPLRPPSVHRKAHPGCVQGGEVYNAEPCSRWTRLHRCSCCRICWCTPLATICSTRGVSCYVYDTCPRRMRGCIHAHPERTCMPVACVKPRQCRHIASARVWHASHRLPFYHVRSTCRSFCRALFLSQTISFVCTCHAMATVAQPQRVPTVDDLRVRATLVPPPNLLLMPVYP